MLTVKQMYKYSSENNVKLLSNYDNDFWDDYVSNYSYYDKIFKRLYSSFLFFEQEEDETTSEVVTNFADAVYGHLLLNDKKYSELYRMNVVDDDDYSLLDNYNLEEKMDKDTSSKIGSRSDSSSYTKGSRSDSSSGTVGQQVVDSDKDVSPYDSENFYNFDKTQQTIGQRSDSGSFTSGQQQDSGTNTLGEQNNSGTEDYTLTRTGNIGTISGSDMMEKHRKLWSTFEFYSYIFGEIAKELLLTGC